MNIKEITEGWSNLLWGSDETTEEIAKERIAICMECPFFQKTFGRCKLCGCHMPAKVRTKKGRCPDIPSRWKR